MLVFRFASWAFQFSLDLAWGGMGLVWLVWGVDSWALIKAQLSKMNPCSAEMSAFPMRMGPNRNPPLENEPMRDGNVDLSDVHGP